MPRYALRINGETHEVQGEADDRLLSVLRYELGLTGSKYGCGEGFCGACTVLVDNQLVRSCTVQLAPVAGKAITTIEAVAQGDRLHPVQEAFLETEAFQCGPRFADVPPIEIVLLDRPDLPSAGAGETPIVCVAPAIGAAARAFGQVDTALPITLTSPTSRR